MKKKKNDLFFVLKKIYKLLERKQKFIFMLIVLIMIISAALTQVTPIAIGWLTNDILGNNVNEISFDKVVPYLIVILIANVVNETVKISRRVLVEDVATKTEKKARGMVLTSLLKAPLSYFRANMTGNIHGKLNRSLDGTVKLEKLLFMDFVPAVFNGIAAIIAICSTKQPILLTLMMMLVIPIGVYLVLKQIKSQKGIRVELLESKSQMDGSIVELINGIEIIRICDSVDAESNRFNNKSEFLRAKEMKHHKAMAFYDLLKFTNQALFTVLIIGVSTYLATKGIISAGSVLTTYLCFTQLLKPLEELHRIFDEVSECTVLAKDFFSMVEIPNDFSYKSLDTKSRNIREAESAVKIENLTFYYNEDKSKTIIDDLNLDIKKEMFLGIAGPSGCGKSSLIKAICKLERGDGKIFIDSKNINNLSRKDISETIALVPQTPFLIAGTIYDNICYGIDEEVPMEAVEEAAKRACIYDYIDSLPNRFDSLISEGGNNLSGGQRQRIAIARIFLRKPKILILDEATSALDNTSEKFIQNEIEKLQKENHTTIISIAHRLTTLKNCDRIIVFNKGKIVEDGQYQELIDQGGIFSDMFYGKLK